MWTLQVFCCFIIWHLITKLCYLTPRKCDCLGLNNTFMILLIQMAIQLAYYRLHGTFAKTYEPASHRSVYKDTILSSAVFSVLLSVLSYRNFEENISHIYNHSLCILHLLSDYQFWNIWTFCCFPQSGSFMVYTVKKKKNLLNKHFVQPWIVGLFLDSGDLHFS